MRFLESDYPEMWKAYTWMLSPYPSYFLHRHQSCPLHQNQRRDMIFLYCITVILLHHRSGHKVLFHTPSIYYTGQPHIPMTQRSAKISRFQRVLIIFFRFFFRRHALFYRLIIFLTIFFRLKLHIKNFNHIRPENVMHICI